MKGHYIQVWVLYHRFAALSAHSVTTCATVERFVLAKIAFFGDFDC